MAAPEFIYDTISHLLYFDRDGTGLTNGPVAVAYLPNLAGSLTASDFTFIA